MSARAFVLALLLVPAAACAQNTGWYAGLDIGYSHAGIDTGDNELFHGCVGPWDVEDTYSAFWNRLNASWERDFPAANHDKVVVVSVVEV